MRIPQWLKEAVWPVLKSAWQRPHDKSKKRVKSYIHQNNDLRNPSHPFNMEQQAADDYNDQRAQELLYDNTR